MTKAVTGPAKTISDADKNGVDDAVESRIFGAVRSILIERTGRGLTQGDVDRIKSAILADVTEAVKQGMRPSARIIQFLHSFEQCRLKAYPDPGSSNGLPVTCGWGSTTDLDGRPIKLGTTWTQEYADAVFKRDCDLFAVGLNMLIGSSRTTQNQFDALFSFAYNVGLDIDEDTRAEGLGDSTLLRKHLAGDYAGAAAEFVKWNKNDGVVMNGLTRRRRAEAAIYLEGL